MRRGPVIPRPADFHATTTRLAERFTYLIDEDGGYIKAVAHRRDDPTPTVYYRLLTDTSSSTPRSGQRWLRPLRYSLAALLIVGVALLGYPYLPGVQYQVSKQVASTVNHRSELISMPAQISETNHLTIPKIGIDTNILEGPSLSILDHEDGVWHQTGNLQNGNFVLAGHRFKYLPPNTSTLYNLHQLGTGDSIIIDWQKTRYTYIVDTVITIPSTQTKILKQTGGPRLTIYTCTNASQTMRTVVMAHRVL